MAITELDFCNVNNYVPNDGVNVLEYNLNRPNVNVNLVVFIHIH